MRLLLMPTAAMLYEIHDLDSSEASLIGHLGHVGCWMVWRVGEDPCAYCNTREEALQEAFPGVL